jgi:protein-S-isoprenylcysteine O-methyltransferase Ste14
VENANLMSTSGKRLSESIVSHRKSWEYLCNTLLGLFYLLFGLGMMADFLNTHRISSALLTIFLSALVYFSLTRPMPKQVNISLYDWAIALGATYLVLLVRPAAQVHDYPLLLGVQLFGMCVSLVGLFSLNKSFGLVAANRGIKTRGMYRVVRHPIYAGYFLSYGAFLAQNMTARNAVIYALCVMLELLRIVAEERVLSQDPAYAAYARRTRWRVLPLVY